MRTIREKTGPLGSCGGEVCSRSHSYKNTPIQQFSLIYAMLPPIRNGAVASAVPSAALNASRPARFDWPWRKCPRFDWCEQPTGTDPALAVLAGKSTRDLVNQQKYSRHFVVRRNKFAICPDATYLRGHV
jgi:hypothetical protein